MYLVFMSIFFTVVSTMFWPPKVSYVLWWLSLLTVVVVYCFHATSSLNLNF
ncbi:DUF5993 family protein [Bartonella sp. DGB1]|uniref:DUF5993 family protein n=1 Tax=Bartonella sp. DGB1 TaxID=3239807 RepID=UPI00352371B7